MLKILHISSEKSWRGGEQQIAYLINELKKMGVENTVLCDRSSEFEKYCVKNSISHYSAGFHGLLDVYSSAKTLKNIASKFDLVHV